MAEFIEFPIFDGVSGDLRPWILWMEDFFVRENFTADEKLNLAQSLLEGEAYAWFSESQETSIFQSWKHLKHYLFLLFGDFRDPELLISQNDRLLQEQRVEKPRKRMETTSLNLQESISSIATIRETITVVDETSEIVAGNLAERAPEKKLVSQYQVPVSSLEPSFSFSSESLDVSQAWQSEIMRNNWVHSQAGVGCVKNKATAYQVFDKMSLHQERLKPRNKRKLSLSLKTWMFKFKNKLLHRNKSTNRILAELNFDAVNVSTSRSNKSSDPSSFVIRVRDYSKYGTVIKTDLGKEEKVHELPHQEKILKDGDDDDEKILSQYRPSMLIEEALLKVVTKPVTEGKTTGFKEVFMTLAAPVSQLNCFNLPLHHVPNNGLLAFPWNLLFLEFFLSIHLEDKVGLSGASNSWCGWMVFDRGKNIIISEDVITIKRDGQKMLLVKVKDAHVDSLVVSFKEFWIEIMDGDIAKLLNSTSGKLQSYGYVRVVMFLRRLRVHHRQQKRKFTKAWKFKYKSRLKKIKLTYTSLRTLRFKSREMKQFVGFVKFQVKHKWRLVWRIWRLHNQVVATREVLLFTEMKTLLIAVIMLKLAAKYLGPFQVVELIGVVVYRLQLPLGSKMCDDVFHVSQLKTVIGDHQQVHSSVPPALLEEELLLPEAIIAVRFEDVRRREFLVQWQHCDSSENSWMISQDPVSLYPAFKLEDKLVLREESIDTIQGLVDDVAGVETQTEDSDGSRGSAVEIK